MLVKKRTLPYAVNEGYLDLMLARMLDEKSYEIRIKPNFKTASWCVKADKHYIVVGNDILKAQNLEEDYKIYEPYIISYLFHEVGHSLFTEPDLKAVSHALKAVKVPFVLMNLFEDARIEHLMRTKSKRAFEWAIYETLNEPKSPSDLLFCIIQNDGIAKLYKEHEHYDRVYEYYYLSMIELNSTWDLIPLLEEWVKEFSKQSEKEIRKGINDAKKPQEPQDGDEDDSNESAGGDGDEQAPSDEPEDQGNEGTQTEDESESENSTNSARSSSEDESEDEKPCDMEDLQLSASLNAEGNDADSFLEDTEDLENALNEGAPRKEVENESVEVSEFTTNTVRQLGRGGHYDHELVKKLLPQFIRLFRSDIGFKNTSQPTRRINLRGICKNDYSAPFRKKLVSARASKDVVIIVDCSGSMGSIMPDMRIVLAIFSELAKRGYVKGYVVLSGVNRGTAMAETLSLPLSEETINEIHGVYGSEGLDHAFKTALPLMQKADWNICLTDGMINDSRIDKRFYNSKRVRTLGIYIGDEDDCDMSPWFDYQAVEPDVKGVVDKMLRLLK
jgi:hypothetical protein